jgi:hypothetical protein
VGGGVSGGVREWGSVVFVRVNVVYGVCHTGKSD